MATNEAERERWNDELWAQAWPKRERLTDQVTPVLLDAVALQPGERVLDIGCGGGRTSLAAAAAVGPGGRVVGADISEPILALARRRADVAGPVANLTFVHGDMQVDRIGDSDFDVAMSQFGVMFFDEPVTAFANMGHHLGAGGRLVFACWQSLRRNPWFPYPALEPFVVPPPAPAPGKSPTGPFTLSDPERVVEILTAAGFESISHAVHDSVVDVEADAVVDDVQIRRMGVEPDSMDDARRAVEEYLREFGDPHGLCRFPIAFQIITATRHRRDGGGGNSPSGR